MNDTVHESKEALSPERTIVSLRWYSFTYSSVECGNQSVDATIIVIILLRGLHWSHNPLDVQIRQSLPGKMEKGNVASIATLPVAKRIVMLD